MMIPSMSLVYLLMVVTTSNSSIEVWPAVSPSSPDDDTNQPSDTVTLVYDSTSLESIKDEDDATPLTNNKVTTNLGAWRKCSNITGDYCSCDGNIRLGDIAQGIYTRPITAYVGLYCTYHTLHKGLWPQLDHGHHGHCECRKASRYRIVSNDQCLHHDELRGLVTMIKDCASSPTGEENNNTIWSYIPSTGQLINGRSCLTAKPAYPYSRLPPSSWNTHDDQLAVDAWQAWHVVSDVCSNTVNKELRQSWDIIITTGHLDNGAGGGGGGDRIRLRYSSDIGQRCLQAVDPNMLSSNTTLDDMPISTSSYRYSRHSSSIYPMLPGHQHLVAAVCGDVTLPSQQWSLWKTITILDNGNSWAACEDAACSQCINEGEIRYNNAHPPPPAAAAYHQDYHYVTDAVPYFSHSTASTTLLGMHSHGNATTTTTTTADHHHQQQHVCTLKTIRTLAIPKIPSSSAVHRGGATVGCWCQDDIALKPTGVLKHHHHNHRVRDGDTPTMMLQVNGDEDYKRKNTTTASSSLRRYVQESDGRRRRWRPTGRIIGQLGDTAYDDTPS
ncbi:hypothetical protein FOZ60_010738 [Perkinsus olseni]|uniref:Uncharacterized protein n=1 Tax=Perkinsus olseni TaxID=32597 RepID=A0A7J6NF01_PEROL|nr:hypothetical protein FOZ60_010738 [Perkinsus olseni]